MSDPQTTLEDKARLLKLERDIFPSLESLSDEEIDRQQQEALDYGWIELVGYSEEGGKKFRLTEKGIAFAKSQIDGFKS